ncbi:hypothetical protein [Oceanotoga phage vB_OteS-UFV02]
MQIIKDLGIIEQKDAYEIEGIASVEVVDRDGDVIFLDGMDLTYFKKNPTVFLQHATWEIGAGAGKVTDLWIGLDSSGNKALFFKATLDNEDPNVKLIYSKLKKGISRAVSIGFRAKEYHENEHGGYNVTKSELTEISLVNIGANQESFVTSVKSLVKSINKDSEGTSTEVITEDILKKVFVDAIRDLTPVFIESIKTYLDKKEETEETEEVEEEEEIIRYNDENIKIYREV